MLDLDDIQLKTNQVALSLAKRWSLEHQALLDQEYPLLNSLYDPDVFLANIAQQYFNGLVLDINDPKLSAPVPKMPSTPLMVAYYKAIFEPVLDIFLQSPLDPEATKQSIEEINSVLSVQKIFEQLPLPKAKSSYTTLCDDMKALTKARIALGYKILGTDKKNTDSLAEWSDTCGAEVFVRETEMETTVNDLSKAMNKVFAPLIQAFQEIGVSMQQRLVQKDSPHPLDTSSNCASSDILIEDNPVVSMVGIKEKILSTCSLPQEATAALKSAP